MIWTQAELRQKLANYRNGTCSREALGVWASHAYYDLLRGGYLETEKLSVYPFVRTLARMRMEPCDMQDTYPCTEQDVAQIWRILSGEVPCSFCIELGIPPQGSSLFADAEGLDWSRREAFSNIYEAVQNGAPSEQILSSAPPAGSTQTNTVLRMLEDRIMELLAAGRPAFLPENSLPGELRLYAGNGTAGLLRGKLVAFLECYLGLRTFPSLISFQAGASACSLLV